MMTFLKLIGLIAIIFVVLVLLLVLGAGVVTIIAVFGGFDVEINPDKMDDSEIL